MSVATLMMALAVIGIAQVHAGVPGADCASRGPSGYQDCINTWVVQQQGFTVPNGVASSTCSSLGPQYYQPCINKWILANLQPPGVIGGCAGVAPANQQACLNALVDRRMQEQAGQLAQQRAQMPSSVWQTAMGGSPGQAGRRLSQSGGQPRIVLGADCASRGPAAYRECINTWVIQQQQTMAGPNAANGATCASIGPDSRQECINGWIQQHLQQPGLIGGCAGVAPEHRQACLDTLVNRKMQEDAEVRGQTCSSVAPAKLQACVNRFLVDRQTKDNASGKVCSVVDQTCVNGYVCQLQLASGGVGGCCGVAPQYRQACVNNYTLSLQQKGSAAPATQQGMGVGSAASAQP